MKTKTRAALDRQVGWHIPLAFLVAVSLVPVLFAVFYSFKSLQSIYGDAGLLSGFTLENFREIARQLPHGRYEQAAGAGHAVNKDRPGAVVRALQTVTMMKPPV